MATATLPRLSGAVGVTPRPNQGPQPKNKSADVKIVQNLLKLAGLRVPVSGRCDAATIEAIKRFQKKVGFKEPDGVVDVNQKTYRLLGAVATKKTSADEVASALGGAGGDGGEESVPVKEFTFKGTKYLLTESDYDKAVAEVAKKMLNLVTLLEDQHKVIVSVKQGMLNTIQGSDGLMQSICFFASAKWAGLDVPSFPEENKAYSAIMKAKGAIKKRDVKAATALLPAAQKAVLAFDKALSKYRNKLIGSSESLVGALEFTRDTSFAVAEVIGVAVLVSRGTSPRVAKTSSAAFFAALKSGATEAGEHLADPKKSWGKSAEKVLVDTLVATATSIIAGGFKGSAIKGWAGTLAKKLITKPPFKQLGTRITQEYLEKLLSEGGQKIVKDGMNEIVKALGEMAKKGRTPTAKEVEKQIMDYLAGLIGGKVADKFKLSTFKYSKGLQTVFEEKNAKKLGDWFAKLPRTKRAKILTDVFSKKQEELVKLGFGKVVDKLKPSASADQIAQEAVKGAMSDKALIAMLQKELKKHQK